MLASAVGKFIAPYLPEAMFQALGFVGSFFVITLLFAMMFKWLPDAASPGATSGSERS